METYIFNWELVSGGWTEWNKYWFFFIWYCLFQQICLTLVWFGWPLLVLFWQVYLWSFLFWQIFFVCFGGPFLVLFVLTSLFMVFLILTNLFSCLFWWAFFGLACFDKSIFGLACFDKSVLHCASSENCILIPEFSVWLYFYPWHWIGWWFCLHWQRVKSRRSRCWQNWRKQWTNSGKNCVSWSATSPRRQSTVKQWVCDWAALETCSFVGLLMVSAISIFLWEQAVSRTVAM